MVHIKDEYILPDGRIDIVSVSWFSRSIAWFDRYLYRTAKEPEPWLKEGSPLAARVACFAGPSR